MRPRVAWAVSRRTARGAGFTGAPAWSRLGDAHPAECHASPGRSPGGPRAAPASPARQRGPPSEALAHDAATRRLQSVGGPRAAPASPARRRGPASGTLACGASRVAGAVARRTARGAGLTGAPAWSRLGDARPRSVTRHPGARQADRALRRLHRRASVVPSGTLSRSASPAKLKPTVPSDFLQSVSDVLTGSLSGSSSPHLCSRPPTLPSPPPRHALKRSPPPRAPPPSTLSASRRLPNHPAPTPPPLHPPCPFHPLFFFCFFFLLLLLSFSFTTLSVTFHFLILLYPTIQPFPTSPLLKNYSLVSCSRPLTQVVVSEGSGT